MWALISSFRNTCLFDDYICSLGKLPVSLEVELDPGQNPYTIVPSTFAMNSEARFTLSLYSDKVCRLEDIPKDAGVD